jgi:spermidine synthase
MSTARHFARWGAIFLTGLGGFCALPSAPAEAQAQRTLVESRESLYNNIYVYRQANYLAMTFGYNR